jgi:CHASE2 domain-containing sensor protein/signal transduction histidine kinase
MRPQANLEAQDSKTSTRHWIDRLLSVGAAVLVLSFLSWVPLGQSFVFQLDDQIFRGLGFKSPSDIVVITLDDRSIDTLGGWPISRTHYTQLLQRMALAENRPRAVGMNILFLDPRTGDEELAKAVARLPVVLATQQKPLFPGQRTSNSALQDGWLLPATPLDRTAHLGHIHTLLHSDGVIRGIQPFLNGQAHMAVAMALAGNHVLQRPISAYEEVRIHTMDPDVGFTSLSLSQALDPSFSLAMLRDKWVLVGPTAASLGDMHITPQSGRTGSPTPGVFLMATALNDVLNDKWVAVSDRTITFAASVVMLALLILFTSQWRPSAMLRLQTGFIALVMVLTVVVLVKNNWWIDTVPFCLALPFGWLFWASRKLEHTFGFLTRQVHQLSSSPRSKPASQSDQTPYADAKPWLVTWLDPVEKVSLELQTRTSNMQESQRLLDAIVVHLPEALAVFDAQDRCVTLNPVMRHFMSRHLGTQLDAPPTMRLSQFRQFLGFDEHQTIPPASPVNLPSPLGNFHYLCTENNISVHSNVAMHMLHIQDVTNSQQLEEQRRKTLEFLSHDMRSPVAGITAVAERMAKPQAEHTQRAAEDILHYTTLLMTMMDGFIDFSLATGVLPKKDVHMLSNLLDDAIAQVRDMANKSHMRIVLKECEPPLAIDCDAHLVVRALVNALVNALNHGQKHCDVVIQTACVEEQQRNWAVVQVENKVGNNPHAPLIKGYGLGLKMIGAVMTQHGGTMYTSWCDPMTGVATSPKGQATLKLTFPSVCLDSTAWLESAHGDMGIEKQHPVAGTGETVSALGDGAVPSAHDRPSDGS